MPVTVLPGDPFMPALGEALQGATASITKGMEERKKKSESKEDASAYGKALVGFMGMDEESPIGQAVLGINDMESLKQLGDFYSKQQETQRKGTPKEVSPAAQTAIAMAQAGQPIPPELMNKITNPEEIRLVGSFQKTNVEERGIPSPKREELYIRQNLEDSNDFRKSSQGAKKALDVTRKLTNLVESGAANNIIGNWVTDHNIEWMMPFFENPGSVGFNTGIKDLFVNFTDTFGARPNVEEFKLQKAALPKMLSTKEGKKAAIYMRESIEKTKIAEYEAHSQAMRELDDTVSPQAISERSEAIFNEERERIYQDWKSKFNDIIYETKKVKKGNVLYYNAEKDEIMQGPADGRDYYGGKGWKPIEK